MIEEEEFRMMVVRTGAIRKLQGNLFQEEGNYEFQMHLNALKDLAGN